ncbi:MAG: NGG1p interacting factor NIF3 [Candidatus Omnitrophota bacterium]
MRLSRLYQRVIKFGKDRDPRRRTTIRSYSDTAILFGDPDIQVQTILIGIDIEVAELLLADRLREKRRLDLVISHHPEGKAYASLYMVMQLQVDLLKKVGVPEIEARRLLEQRCWEVERKLLSANHMRPVDAARLLNLPFMCVHTPADNHAHAFLQGIMDKEKPKKIRNILDILMGIPEYQQASLHQAGPRVILGNPERPVGKVLIEMTGGTEGPRDVFDKLYKAGVRTLICMHLSEEHFKKVKDTHLNVVIAGHISSDTLGLNLLLDRIEKEEVLQFIDCSGFKRIRRN